MTVKQKLRNRTRAAKQRATLAVAIERFKKTAGGVSARHSTKHYDVTEYPDSKIEGLALRVMVYKHPRKGKKAEPELRWFFKRPGRRALEINCRWEETSREAREQVRLLLAGAEDTIMCTYLSNESSRRRSSWYHYFDESELLQNKTLAEIEERIAQNKEMLARQVSCRRERFALDWVFPMRRKTKYMEEMLERYKRFMKREGLEIRIKAKPFVARKAA
jgi:hypothetical protein